MAIVSRVSYRAIAARYGVGYRSVPRHFACMARLYQLVTRGAEARPEKVPSEAAHTFCLGPDGLPFWHKPGRRYCRRCWPPRGRGKGEHSQSPRRLAAWSKGYRAAYMRIDRKTYAEIARALGYADRSGAYRAVKRFLPA